MTYRMSIDERIENSPLTPHYTADCVIIGGGLIGIAIALEMQDRGAAVVVVERSRSLGGASIAAAGMLAVDDPHNPAAIRDLSRLSAAAYPSFLRRIKKLSGIEVLFQTCVTVQHWPDGTSRRLSEHSIDPRQLAEALYIAIRNTPVVLLDNSFIATCKHTDGGSSIRTSNGNEILTKTVVYAAGAWTAGALTPLESTPVPIAPRKGQMLRVRLPPSLDLCEVYRNEHVYIVPRVFGPQAGSALIGATVEDVGFDVTLRPEAISRLRTLAAELIPGMASETETPLLESWAGLRPSAPDSLPILGPLSHSGHYIATGHYRNGILLAPGTAHVVADLIQGKQPDSDITPFSLSRYLTL